MADDSEPNLSEVLFIRPRDCTYCGNGFYAMAHVVQYARSKGYSVTDLFDAMAEMQEVYFNIVQKNPQAVFGFGHGSPYRFTGNSQTDIFNMENTSWLDDRMVYLLSCQTGAVLGQAMVSDGADSYAGYTEDWTWLCGGGADIDPYMDSPPYGKSFFESANQLWISLLDGRTFAEAVSDTVAKYNEWIDYWFNSGDPNMGEAIAYLVWDRDALIMYGNPDAKLGFVSECDQYEGQGQSTCESAGCSWWPNGLCRTTDPPDSSCLRNVTQIDCEDSGCVWLPEGYCRHAPQMHLEPVLLPTTVMIGLLVVGSAIVYVAFQEKKHGTKAKRS
jgi:hypothetical protein